MARLQAIVRELLKPDVLIGLGVFSVFAFLVTALVVPIALARMPADHFTRPGGPKHKNPFVRVLQNLLGFLLIALGIAMLVLPGQGLLTVLLGLGLAEFPGKRRIQLTVIANPTVLKTVNALRRRFDREPLEIPRRG